MKNENKKNKLQRKNWKQEKFVSSLETCEVRREWVVS